MKFFEALVFIWQGLRLRWYDDDDDDDDNNNNNNNKYNAPLLHRAAITTVLRPFVWDYPGEPVPEKTLSHPPSWSSSNLYQLLPSTKIHSILPVQITCLAIFFWWISWKSRQYSRKSIVNTTWLLPTSVLRPLCRTICGSRHYHEGLCWSKKFYCAVPLLTATSAFV